MRYVRCITSAKISAVHDGKLHTNSRRRQSTPAVRQSAEDDRSALCFIDWTVMVVGVLLLRAVDLEFAARESP